MTTNKFDIGSLVYFREPIVNTKLYGIITNINDDNTCDIDSTYTYYGAYDFRHYTIPLSKVRDANPIIDTHINKLKRQIETQEQIRNTKNPKETYQKIQQGYKLDDVVEQALQ